MKDNIILNTILVCLLALVAFLLILIGYNIGKLSVFNDANKAGVAIKQLNVNTGEVEIVFGQFKQEKKCTK